MPTTSAPPLNVTSIVPGLAPLARTAILLHPRRGECTPLESKIGGRFAWPVEEPWPWCEEHDCPFIPVVQLRTSEFPELRFPPGAELMQLLWCPNFHDENEYAPQEHVLFREVLPSPPFLGKAPEALDAEPALIPLPCCLEPERVVEYPGFGDLPEDVARDVAQAESIQRLAGELARWWGKGPLDASDAYDFLLSAAPGTKLGGYAVWNEEPEVPECSCGQPMELVLTLSSYEFDPLTSPRWSPVRDTWKRPTHQRNALQAPTELMLGDAGSMLFFTCRHCSVWPIRAVFQSS